MTKEFKIKKFKDTTVYTLESATSGATGSGSVPSVSNSIGGIRRRGDNLIAQEGDKDKVDAGKPRNFVAKNAKMGGAGAHKDKKKEQKQGKEKHKKPVMEDHEIRMASNELKSIHGDAKKLLILVQRYGEQGNLEAWQQSKITKAADYLNSVLQSIGGEQGVAESDGTTTSNLDAVFNEHDFNRLEHIWPALEAGDKEEALRQINHYLRKGKNRAWWGDLQALDIKIDPSDIENSQVMWSKPIQHRMAESLAETKKIERELLEGWFNFGGSKKTKPGQLELYKAFDTFTIYYDREPEVFVVVGAGEYKDKFPAKGFDDSYNAEFYGEQMTDQKRDKKPIKVNTTLDLSEDWQKANRRDKTDGMSRKAVKAYRRENPGSKLKTAVTTKPSKLKKGGKAAKRRKSFCARMSGNKGPMKKPNGKPTPKALALRRWNCEEDAYMNSLNAQMLEKLNPQAPVDTWVKDFQKADPNKYHQFKNKTPQKKAQMAVAARYAANEPSKKK